jgi:hypothetical protein
MHNEVNKIKRKKIKCCCKIKYNDMAIFWSFYFIVKYSNAVWSFEESIMLFLLIQLIWNYISLSLKQAVIDIVSFWSFIAFTLPSHFFAKQILTILLPWKTLSNILQSKCTFFGNCMYICTALKKHRFGFLGRMKIMLKPQKPLNTSTKNYNN